MAAGENGFSSRPAWEPQAQLLPAVSGVLALGLGSPVPPQEKARGDAGVWRRALPGILSGLQSPGLLATSLPSLLAFRVLSMDQVLALETAREVPRPRAEEGLLTAEAAWLPWVHLCCLVLGQVLVLHS